MKDIKKSASFTSKQKGKDVKFNIDLNYSPEYDSFIIKVKEGEGFMAYSSNIERMPLEVIQKLNEMLEEVLIKAGSKTEMKEHKMFDGGNFQSGVYNKGGAVRNERLHVNKDEDYEVRYSKPRPHRKGYKGLRNFEGGGGVKKFEMKPYQFIYRELDDEDSEQVIYSPDAVKEFIKDFNKDMKTNYKNWEDFNKGEEYREFYPIMIKVRKFNGGGEMDLNDDKRLRVRKPVMPERKMSEQEWAEKHNPRAYEYMTKRKMATGGGVGSFKVGDKVKIKYISDYSRHNNEIGTITWLNEYNYYPNKDYSVVKKKTQAIITYKDGSEEGVSDLYAKGSGVTSSVKKVSYATGGGVGLIGNQKRIDMNHNGKIDAEDFKLLRSSMNGAWRNERKHVNHSEDYEVRYARKKPARTGYKGKRNFEGGGGISKFKMLSDKVARNYEGKRVKPQYQKEYGKVYSKSEAKEVGNKVAGKVKSMQKAESGTVVKKGTKGGIMTLAKKIRKDGESWQDAVKRAGQQLK